MSNISIILIAYKGIYGHRFIFVGLLTLLYPIMIVSNAVLIYTIYSERSLHKPLYILICNLACINVYGGSGLTPFVLVNIVSGNFHISKSACLIQTFSVMTFGGCEIMNLMVMAYDRYISICFPLHYEKIMSSSKVMKLIALIWLLPFIRTGISIMINANLKMCGRIIEKVYCDNYSMVKLACSGIREVNIYGSTVTFFSVVPPLLIILYSYIKILMICSKLTQSGQAKALNTCIPHLVAIANFFIGCSFEVYQSRFDMNHIPYTLRVVLSLYFLILSPVFNPILYGVRTQKIKVILTQKLMCRLKV
ncbi:olfactory receptor 4K17-like [Alosa sapidissima]|uniref:olfactory receptor 4K17-like n=1 Tax=Alosa sapidissima TaxID=34773 RepID=UPI001C08299C|nr:olfactory receptor 4K17-like [Alosa sapidissima]